MSQKGDLEWTFFVCMVDENLLELIVVVAIQLCEYVENQGMTSLCKFCKLTCKIVKTANGSATYKDMCFHCDEKVIIRKPMRAGSHCSKAVVSQVAHLPSVMGIHSTQALPAMAPS